jgi:hypothetical protein
MAKKKSELQISVEADSGYPCSPGWCFEVREEMVRSHL